jgi:DnaJ-class molecular chaperone
MSRQDTPLFDDKDKENDDDTDTCNMCGGSGYLDLEQTKLCPDCKGKGSK